MSDELSDGVSRTGEGDEPEERLSLGKRTRPDG